MTSPTTPTPAPQAPAANSAMNAAVESFNRILVTMISVSERVSDLIFSPGRPPQVELNSKLTPVEIPGLEMIKPEHTATIATVMTHNNRVATAMRGRSRSVRHPAPWPSRR